MWALFFGSVIGLVPPGDLKLETVNGQVVKLHISRVVLPDTPAERAKTAAFLDAAKRRFKQKTAGSP